METSIKNIHNIWFDFKNINKIPNKNEFTEIQNEYIKLNPVYNYKLWELNDAFIFLKQYYPKYLDIMNINTEYNIIKCDFFRYLLMYHYGGFYFDLDFYPLRNFDKFINDNELIKKYKIFLNKEIIYRDCETYINGCLISLEKNNKFWLLLIEEIYDNLITKNIIINDESDVYKYTGTKYIYNQYNKYKYDDIKILDSYYFYPYIITNKEQSIVIWMKEKEYFINKNENHISLNISNEYFQICKKKYDILDLLPDSYVINIVYERGSLWK